MYTLVINLLIPSLQITTAIATASLLYKDNPEFFKDLAANLVLAVDLAFYN